MRKTLICLILVTALSCRKSESSTDTAGMDTAMAAETMATAAAQQSQMHAQQRSQPPVDAFIAVNGVRLHYVDWGGRGDAMLLLAGAGDHAHVFDAFAPAFTDAFRVLALTRRGVGQSDKPPAGYDTATLVEDIRQFLDKLKIDRVHLVGHSMAGDELTLFATKYPQRVIKLVYLDAAFNRYRKNAMALSDPGISPLWKRAILESRGAPEAAAITVSPMPPPDRWRVLVASVKARDAFKADYRAIRAPALAFYAGVPTNHPASKQESDLARRKKLDAWWAANMVPRLRESREQFQREMRNGEVVLLPDAGHYVFVGKTQDQVVAKTRAFLLRK